MATQIPSTIPSEREIPAEHDAWELQRLTERLSRCDDSDLAENLGEIERARNTLNQVIGRARKARRDAA